VADCQISVEQTSLAELGSAKKKISCNFCFLKILFENIFSVRNNFSIKKIFSKQFFSLNFYDKNCLRKKILQ